METDKLVPNTGLSCVALGRNFPRLFFQRVSGRVDQARLSSERRKGWTSDMPPIQPVITTPLASVIYNDEKEIRLYYLDAKYVVQESCYSEGKGWYQGGIGEMNAKACHASGLAAAVHSDGKGGVYLRVYYQETGSYVIKELANDGSWRQGELCLVGAIAGTNLAAVAYMDYSKKRIQSRLYYQAADLYLREHCYDNYKWFPGDFNPGKAFPRTPISAVAFGQIVVEGRGRVIAELKLETYWRTLGSEIAVAKNRAGSWGSPIPVEGVEYSGRNFTVLQTKNREDLRRLYIQNLAGTAVEYIRCEGESESWEMNDRAS